MPTLARFDGIEIWMNTRDHLPAHVHCSFRDEEVVVVIADGSIYAGSMSARALKACRDWIAANRDNLVQRWATYSKG